jgi:hypothetical protein
MAKRALWCVIGCLVADAVLLVLHLAAGWSDLLCFGPIGGALAVAYGQKTGRLESVERVSKPISIFDGRIPRT